MKVCALSMHYNECDVIEPFIRINSRCVDHFFVVDNGCTDATPLILKKLQEEGCPITVWTDFAIDYQQAEVTNRALRRIASMATYDWVLVLDADEFLAGTRNELENELSSVPPAHGALLNWKTFVPKSDAYFEHENPIPELFEPRKLEYRQYSKVALPQKLAEIAFVTTGNHSALHENTPIRSKPINIPLAHFPVRSSPQIISKVIISSYKNSLYKRRVPNQAFHIDIIADLIRKKGYELDAEDLRNIAFSYALGAADPVGKECDSTPSTGFSNGKIVYRELSQIDLISRFDAFIKVLCKELNDR